jgi:hypothetical protein
MPKRQRIGCGGGCAVAAKTVREDEKEAAIAAAKAVSTVATDAVYSAPEQHRTGDGLKNGLWPSLVTVLGADSLKEGNEATR